MNNQDQENLLKVEIAKVDLEIKKAELLSKQREINEPRPARRKMTLELATIIVALLGFVGSFVGTTLQGFFSEKQKRQEFEAALITRAVEAGDSSVSRRNLKFLLDAGLISDKTGKIQQIVIDTSYTLPSLGIRRRRNITTDGEILVVSGVRKYHLPECRLVNDSGKQINLKFATESGLEPCKFCDPPVYALHDGFVQCQAITKAGTQCPRLTNSIDEYCFQHQR